ncbi:hypothetical protein GYMLUDRAFT_253511 [Collybiopsis luxurians FD-317 M1]|uniref:Uncharacterized protein n=1 Tax=Collybiopsis luxurians FD-317 M1 TaxID=944289 RepID=A0A0D0C4Y7_9AGAR|nr:hypothetical protein GYMLUDRAFT_253511 [Collybiopsis luxurians FD-317 M1]
MSSGATGLSEPSGISGPTRSHNSLPTAIIAEIVIGSVAALAIPIICYLLHRRHQARFRSVLNGLITGPIILTNQLEGIVPYLYHNPPLPEPTSMQGDTRETVAGPSESGESHSMQPIVARLESMQNKITWLVAHMQRLESRREYDENSTTGRSDAPPTYASQ